MIKKLDTYLDLCSIVYDLSKPIPPEDAYNFYRFYVEAGFNNIKTIKAFYSSRSPDPKDEVVIYECRK